ncbi:MAG: GAF domain-containing protein, partial [Pseudomonadota bacterium]
MTDHRGALEQQAEMGMAQVVDVPLNILVEVIKDCCNAEAASLLLYDASTDELSFAVAVGEAGSKIQDLRLSRGQGVAWQVFETRTPVLVEDTRQAPQFSAAADQMSGFETRSLIATPLLARDGGCPGVVEVVNKRGGGALDQAQLSHLLQIQLPLSHAVEAALEIRQGQAVRIGAFYAALLKILNLQARRIE